MTFDIQIEQYHKSLSPWETKYLVTLSGDVDLASRNVLAKKLSEIQMGHVIVDLSGSHYVDSFGLTQLLHLYQRLKDQNGTIIFRGLNPLVKRVFSIAQLDRIFQIEESQTNDSMLS